MLARADADQRPPAVPESIELRSLLAEVGGCGGEPRVPVTVVAGDPVLADADREELRRALSNLVDNAVRHATSAVELDAITTDAGSRVSRSATTVRESTRPTASGSSTGSPDWTTPAAATSGDRVWGLAIVRELVTRAGGKVRFVDGSGRWTLRRWWNFRAHGRTRRRRLCYERASIGGSGLCRSGWAAHPEYQGWHSNPLVC